MTWFLRLLVRLVRRRRYRDMAARIRALEVGLGLVQPTVTEAHETRNGPPPTGATLIPCPTKRHSRSA